MDPVKILERLSMENYVDVPFRVRYAETDQMGVAYYANYLVWFEASRAGYCRARNYPYSRMEKEDGIFLPVVEAHCRYLSALRYDQEFFVRTFLQEFRRRSCIFEYQVRDQESGQLCAEGWTKHLFIDSEGKVKSFPKSAEKIFVEK